MGLIDRYYDNLLVVQTLSNQGAWQEPGVGFTWEARLIEDLNRIKFSFNPVANLELLSILAGAEAMKDTGDTLRRPEKRSSIQENNFPVEELKGISSGSSPVKSQFRVRCQRQDER